jgi:hypothetical protein
LIAERDQARGDVEPLRASCYELEERVIQSAREIDVWQERFEVMREAWRKIAATAERERDEALRVQEALRLKAKNLARERDEWKVEAHTQAELYRERCRERNEALGNAVFWKAQHDTKEALLFDKAQRFERERDEARMALAVTSDDLRETELELCKAEAERDEARRKNKNVIASELQAIRDRNEARAKLPPVEWVSYEDHCRVAEKLQNERDEAQAKIVQLRHQLADAEQAEFIRQQERDEAQVQVALLQERRAKLLAEAFQFERERDEARAELAHLSTVMDREDGEALRLERERDEALSLLRSAQVEREAVADQHEAQCDGLEAERDEARADLAKAEGYAVYLSQAWRSDCIVDELADWLEAAQAHCDARNNT